jgi:hypothetical protein
MTYLDALAEEIRRAVPSDALPGEDTSSLFRIYAVLLIAKGEAVTREDVHNAWVAWMLDKGETHESMVPFADLSAETQAEDSPFMVAVRTVARRHALTSDSPPTDSL